MLPSPWSQMALRPSRAHGEPLFAARIRAQVSDFEVHEELGFEPSGAGPHWLLLVRKRGANTEWVARELAKFGGHRSHDVGFAGLKDRHAVATQWFSMPAGRFGNQDLLALRGDGFEVLQAHPHHRKLRRGALQGNRFNIVLTGLPAPLDTEAVVSRLHRISADGVPNYFGAQRFGRDLGNLRRALVAAQIVQARAAGTQADSMRWHGRDERSFALSAARSLIFNTLLSQRVADGSWRCLLPGDIANFDGGGTVFGVSEVDDSLQSRLTTGELHATGPLWGATALQPQGEIEAWERAAAAACAPLDQWVLAEELRAERRALRLRVRDLRHEWLGDQSGLRLSFALTAGAYATTVLGELAEITDAAARADHADSST